VQRGITTKEVSENAHSEGDSLAGNTRNIATTGRRNVTA
jgi:hypothetical protein